MQFWKYSPSFPKMVPAYAALKAIDSLNTVTAHFMFEHVSFGVLARRFSSNSADNMGSAKRFVCKFVPFTINVYVSIFSNCDVTIPVIVNQIRNFTQNIYLKKKTRNECQNNAACPAHIK